MVEGCQESEVWDIYIVDNSAKTHAGFIERVLELSGVRANIYAFENQEEGVGAVGKHPKTVVLCGVSGNALESIIGSGIPWAKLSVEECVAAVKERNPDAKLVVFTVGTYYEADALRDGADGYFFKPDITQKVDGRYMLVDVIEKSLNGTYFTRDG